MTLLLVLSLVATVLAIAFYACWHWGYWRGYRAAMQRAAQICERELRVRNFNKAEFDTEVERYMRHLPYKDL